MITDADEAEIEASRAPLLEHLIELRARLIQSLIAFVVMFFVIFCGYPVAFVLGGTALVFATIGWAAGVFPFIGLSNIILRPFTLAIRLFANMFAGHMLITIAAVGTLYLWGEGGVLNYILGVLPFVGSLGLVFFELLICSLQAYVFVLLTAIYLESSLADSH